MVKKEPVNVNLQTLLILPPFVCIWVFYRIEKLRRGLGLMFGITLAVLFVAVMMGVITAEKPSEFTNWTVVLYALSVAVGIYYVRKWSEEWNAKIEKFT